MRIIKTQNLKEIVFVNHITSIHMTVDEKSKHIVASCKGDCCFIGDYSTVERMLRVLDLLGDWLTMESTLRISVVTSESEPYLPMSFECFQMPDDDEKLDKPVVES